VALRQTPYDTPPWLQRANCLAHRALPHYIAGIARYLRSCLKSCVILEAQDTNCQARHEDTLHNTVGGVGGLNNTQRLGPYTPTSPMDVRNNILGGNITMNSRVKIPTARNLMNDSIETPWTPESNVSWVDNAHSNKGMNNQEDQQQLKLAGKPSPEPKRSGTSKHAATSYWTPELEFARNPALKSPPAPPIPSSNLEPLIDIDTIANESTHNNTDDPSVCSFSGMFVYQMPEQQPVEGQGENADKGLGSRRRRSLRSRLRLVEPSYSGGICLPEAKRRQTWDPSMLKLTLDDLDSLE